MGIRYFRQGRRSARLSTIAIADGLIQARSWRQPPSLSPASGDGLEGKENTMLILRLLFVLSALAIILVGGMYVFTRNRYYLRLAWQIVRFTLFVLERYVLIGWRILV
jgi:hypothetical protein